MIPDKIYIRHYWMPEELDDEWRLKPVEDEQCEEYIRKNALLDYLNSIQEKHKGFTDAELVITIKDLVNKINEL